MSLRLFIAPFYSISFLLSIYDSNENIDCVHGKSNFFIEILGELKILIDKQEIFDEKQISVGSPHSGV
jgi:hypothetical protein